jgi:4-hydroxybenzoate polyprenyltransferase
MIGYVIGAGQVSGFDLRVFILVLLCMIFARSAAMAFNRFIDWKIDAKNPRTANREIPAGEIHPRHALWFVIANAAGFLIAAIFINPLCGYLAPLALFIILIYSYSKRFTALCHVILGVGLGLAPVGAFVAVTGEFSLPIILIGVSVVFWVAGFDIIYALQDDDFDASQNLRSIPVWLGRPNALMLSRFFHMITAICMLFAAWLLYERFEWFHYLSMVGVLFFIASLIYQHSLVSKDDLSKIGMAFFTTNGLASLMLGCCVIVDYMI